MSRLDFDTRSAAQKRADEIHEALKADSPLYKASCDAGQTLRWAIVEDDGSGKYKIPVDNRCEKALTDTEKTKVLPWQADDAAEAATKG